MAEEGVEAKAQSRMPEGDRLGRCQGIMERFGGNMDYMYIETGFFG